MIRLMIDGQNVEVPDGTTVLQASRIAGIEIPTLCDHPALEPYGGCRLCVVEIEGARSLQASCTLPAENGMVVHTNSPKIREARKFVLTMIFSERNHFCMVCQKTDGDCELQNSAYGEEMTHWPIQPSWNPYPVDASNPYFVFDHNRCILCRRCVRACGTLVGNFTLDIENRGARSIVSADYGIPIGESSCINCGTCVQICPTGALIDRSSAYLGQNKTTDHINSTCIGCSLGCGIEILVRDNQMVRIDGDWNAPVNQGLLCEMGRYQPLSDNRQRITTPLARKNGTLQPVSWDEALQTISSQLTHNEEKNGSIAAMASTRLPAEALYTFKQIFCDRLHSSMVASVEENYTTGLQNGAALDGDLDALKTADCVVVIGADLGRSHPVASFFINRNLPLGTRLILIDPNENELAVNADYGIRINPGSDYDLLQGIQAALTGFGQGQVDPKSPTATSILQKASQATGVPVETIVEAGQALARSHKPVFIYGKGITQNESSRAYEAIKTLAKSLVGAALINVKGKANSLAAHFYGLDLPFNPRSCQAAYLALGDDEPASRLVTHLENVPFLAVQASYTSPMTERADVVLPVGTWAEQEGHYLNLEGRLQAAHKALKSPEGVRSNVEVLQELGKMLDFEVNDRWQDAILKHVPQAALAEN